MSHLSWCINLKYKLFKHRIIRLQVVSSLRLLETLICIIYVYIPLLASSNISSSQSIPCSRGLLVKVSKSASTEHQGQTDLARKMRKAMALVFETIKLEHQNLYAGKNVNGGFTLPKPNSLPLKIGHHTPPKGSRIIFQLHPFSGAKMLVSGMVINCDGGNYPYISVYAIPGKLSTDMCCSRHRSLQQPICHNVILVNNLCWLGWCQWCQST